MTPDPVTVAGDLGVDELIRDYLWRYRCSAFPVVVRTTTHRSGHAQPVAGAGGRRPRHPPRAPVATPMGVAVARPDEPVVDPVARLGPRYRRRALVVDAGGDLVGIVTGATSTGSWRWRRRSAPAPAPRLTARQRRRPQGRGPFIGLPYGATIRA